MEDRIAVAFALSLALPPVLATAAPPAFPNGYIYQATFTVAAGQVPSALTNFPALISGTFADFATTASGGRISNTCTQNVGNNSTSVPCDLIFTSDAAGTQLLSWEFETWTPATGAVNIWVNVPNLSGGTVIYAWYGRPSATTLQTTPSATWSGRFMAVYHLKEDPTGPAPQMNDSTANGNNATMNGSVLASQQQSGEFDSGVNFEGNAWASLANPANFSFERTDSFSLSGWFKIASNSLATLLSKFTTGNAGWALLQDPGATNPVFSLGLFGAGQGTSLFAETPPVSLGAWHYVVATYSGAGAATGINIYVDGVNQPLTVTANNLATSILNNTTPAINGRGGPTQMSTDSMGELRVSTKGVVDSPAWVTASFNNQSQPGTFFSAATGLTPGGSSAASPSNVMFPNQTVNTTGSAQVVTIDNNGLGALTISGITVTGADPGDFSQTNNCPRGPATLAADGSCTIDVTFTPLAAGARSAALTITDNGAGIPQSVGLSGMGTPVAYSPQTWPNGYDYQATFTVPGGRVPSALANFPALISGIFADFATTASGGKISNTCTQTVGNNSTSVPCDLIFTSDAAGTQLLSWEFETWTPTTGAVNIWVNVPTLGNGTTIYAWYGQPSVTTLQTTPSATWSNRFMAVYHLKENPAGGAPQMNDSTANGNNATMNGPVLASQQQPGEIGGSVNFEGNTWASLANPANFSFERTDSFSLSGWFKSASNSVGTLFSKFTNGNAGWALLQDPGATNPVFSLGLFGAGQSTSLFAETPAVSLGAWHYVVATYSGAGGATGINIYVDGVNQPLTVTANNLATSILNNTMPAINGRGGPTQMSTDSMDELRVSTKGVVFSPAWVTASFNNQSQPETFFKATTGMTATLSSNYSSLAYGAIPVAPWTPAFQTATLTNIGTSNITVSGIAIPGGSGAYTTTSVPAAPFALAPHQTAAVTVTFDPMAGGTATGQVSIASNATNSPLGISLNGFGIHWTSLTWTPSDTPVIIGYNVYGATVAGGPYVKLGSSTGTAYVDSGAWLTPGSKHYYVVTAVSSAGTESAYSNPVMAVTPTP